MRVVIDTNVFVSASFGGIPREVIGYIDRAECTLCVSQPIVEEYLNVLNRNGSNRVFLEKVIFYCTEADTVSDANLLPTLHVVEKDPSDNKFIECAVVLQAEYIVTGDHALLEIAEYEGIQIVTPREFVEIAEHAKRKK